MTTQPLRYLIPLLALSTLAVSVDTVAQDDSSPHSVRTTKFTIDDVDASTAFYEDLVGLRELDRFVAEGRLVEPFMGFGGGGRIGLLAYTKKETVEKSPHPVSVIFTPDLDAVAQRFEAAQYPIRLVSGEVTGGVRIGIVRDPSGNAIEMVEREGAPAVGGARLIVHDRQASEEFFVGIFGVQPGQRIQTDTFDEVFMDFGEGMFVALFEPKGDPSLAKSQHPVVAIYSTEFDAVLERVKAGGLGVEERSRGMFSVTTPFPGRCSVESVADDASGRDVSGQRQTTVSESDWKGGFQTPSSGIRR